MCTEKAFDTKQSAVLVGDFDVLERGGEHRLSGLDREGLAFFERHLVCQVLVVHLLSQDNGVSPLLETSELIAESQVDAVQRKNVLK